MYKVSAIIYVFFLGLLAFYYIAWSCSNLRLVDGPVASTQVVLQVRVPTAVCQLFRLKDAQSRCMDYSSIFLMLKR